MKTAIVHLKSTAPLSMSRNHRSPKLEKETADAYENRTWIEKGHFDENDELYIPPMMLKFALDSTAKELSRQIPGRGKKTYKSAFLNGIMIVDSIKLGIKKQDVQPTWFHAHADGMRGSGKRVLRAVPTIPKWQAKATIHVLNDSITEEVLQEHIEECGRFNGLGQFRPQNGGVNGRFVVEKIEWK